MFDIVDIQLMYWNLMLDNSKALVKICIKQVNTPEK